MGILTKIGRELGLVPKHRHRTKAKAKARARRRRMPPRKKNGEFKKR